MGLLYLILGVPIGLFLGMLALLEHGRRWGKKHPTRGPDGGRSAVSVADGAVFALFGLLIAFCFSGAAERFYERSRMVTAEANALGTSWLRLDLLPPEAREQARADMRSYVDARLAVYRAFPDHEAAQAAIAVTGTRQTQLWSTIQAARGGEHRPWEILVLPPINESFDVATERIQSMLRHPPQIIFVLLVTLGLGCALLAGISMSGTPRRPMVHMVAFAAVVSLTIYVILDVEYPRHGLIRLDGFDQVLVDLRRSMG